jgi:tRNA (Thr-GGU) A37 N-methylase
VEVHAIGFVESLRKDTQNDCWGGAEACITLNSGFPADALEGLTAFSHVEVLFLFHEVDPSNVVVGARHPRDNAAWPAVGIFAQRGRVRPNRLGTTMCRVLGVTGTRLFVAELDAIDGTPVLDLKPVMKEFLPREPVRQPRWSHEVMRGYWTKTR